MAIDDLPRPPAVAKPLGASRRDSSGPACYDLTSSYFETEKLDRSTFPSLAYGYSRDHPFDRPQIVIGLLVTSDGIPIAHHVFSGNTAGVSTLPGVMEDLKARFGVAKIALVADRSLISEDHLDLVKARGFDHVLATRLHRDDDVMSRIGTRGPCFSVKELLHRGHPREQALHRHLTCPLTFEMLAGMSRSAPGSKTPHRPRATRSAGKALRSGKNRRRRPQDRSVQWYQGPKRRHLDLGQGCNRLSRSKAPA
ncbi:MAG: IS1634 family transposase [Acidimicrobiales bacterium]